MSYQKKFKTLELKKEHRLTSPSLCVAVRLKNEIELLPAFWESLERQTALDEVEFIFLDSGSTDGTLEFLLEKRCTVYTIESSEFSFSKTCNLLFELSLPPVICFLSGHVQVVEEKFFQEIIDFCCNRKLVAGYVRQVPSELAGYSPYEVAYLARTFPTFTEKVVDIGLNHSFSNSASFITRDSWLLTPIPEVIASEDWVWANQHILKGGKIYYLSHLSVRHSHNLEGEQIRRRVEVHTFGKFGNRVMPLRAMYYLLGVFIFTLFHGANLLEAFSSATNHAIPYLFRRSATLNAYFDD